jgi:2-(1,2-epoxy-1,2-dihydrophenyl)acetyl-CoA isomerase
MTKSRIKISRQERVLTISLNRPEKRNAIDTDMSSELLAALDAGSHDSSVGCIVLRGEGKIFCAGRDVSAPPTEAELHLVQDVSQAIVGSPKPVLASVHGWAVGAGFEWMLNADLVVAAEGTRFRLPEATLGVFVTGGLSVTLAASIGLARAKALMLLGDTFTALDAHDWGLLWKIVDDDKLATESGLLAARLAALNPLVSHQFKRTLNTLGLAAFDRAVQLENDAHRVIAASIA